MRLKALFAILLAVSIPAGARAAFGEACGSSHAQGCFSFGALHFNGVGELYANGLAEVD